MPDPTPDEAAVHLRYKVDRLPDSDAITVEKTYVRALLAERVALRARLAELEPIVRRAQAAADDPMAVVRAVDVPQPKSAGITARWILDGETDA